MNRDIGWPRPAPIPRKSASARQQWSAARVFQQKAQRLLATVPFVEWLLLETLQELMDEANDAVTQVELARRCGLSERVVSYWFTMMNEFGLIDRGPDADGRAWRVILTDLGERTLQLCNERLEEAGLTG
jgi:DNA-binding MarR family transcriptional regulator